MDEPLYEIAFRFFYWNENLFYNDSDLSGSDWLDHKAMKAKLLENISEQHVG